MTGYEKNVKMWKKAYSEILEVCNKYQDFEDKFSFYDINEMTRKAKNHLELIDWYEKYGLKIDHDHQLSGYNYFKIDDHRFFSYYEDAEADKEKGSGRFISWSDDGRQPEDEWLFCIGFSTGAYIFGDDYPQNIFEKFWLELKSYKPKYCDSANHTMYFSLEKSKKVYYKYQDILNKYHEMNKKDYKKRKIEKMKAELAELETNK